MTLCLLTSILQNVHRSVQGRSSGLRLQKHSLPFMFDINSCLTFTLATLGRYLGNYLSLVRVPNYLYYGTFGPTRSRDKSLL